MAEREGRKERRFSSPHHTILFCILLIIVGLAACPNWQQKGKTSNSRRPVLMSTTSCSSWPAYMSGCFACPAAFLASSPFSFFCVSHQKGPDFRNHMAMLLFQRPASKSFSVQYKLRERPLCYLAPSTLLVFQKSLRMHVEAAGLRISRDFHKHRINRL